jgi:DNA helicase HerA-like ATPase
MSVISLGFIPEVHDQQFFVSRLLAEARRFCRQRPSSGLQGLLVLDEADLYMPAQSNPATKAPMLDLLRRARSGGLGIILGTQSPGDLDYKGRDNIATWVAGRIQTRTAIDKVTFTGEGTDVDLHALLPTFKTGRFFLKSEGLALQLQARRSLIETRQLSQEAILAVAARVRNRQFH